MEKTDAAVADVLSKFVEAAQQMSGPAYQAVLASCRAAASGDIASFWVFCFFVVCVSLFSIGMIISCLRSKDIAEGQGIVTFFSSFFALIMIGILISGIPKLVMAKTIIDHPDVCIGRMINNKLGGT